MLFRSFANLSPTVIERSFGMAWGIGGWSMPNFMEQIGPAEVSKLKARVAAEIRTTFASHFSKEISLVDAVLAENITAYTKLATGEKYLVNPTRG